MEQINIFTTKEKVTFFQFDKPLQKSFKTLMRFCKEDLVASRNFQFSREITYILGFNKYVCR